MITLTPLIIMTLGKGTIPLMKFLETVLTVYVMLIFIPLPILMTELIHTQTSFWIKEIPHKTRGMTFPRIIKTTLIPTFMVTHPWKLTRSLIGKIRLIYSRFLTLTIFITNRLIQTRL